MRACGVCFFGRITFDAEEGECFLEPPKVFLIKEDETGEIRSISLRPIVGRQEYCKAFSHRNEKPAPRAEEEQV